MEKQFALNHFIEFEGFVPHFYLDGEGLITVGIGFAVPDIKAALNLPLVDNKTNTVARYQQVVDEYLAIHTLEASHLSQYYEKYTNLHLQTFDVYSIFYEKLDKLIANLQILVPGFGTYPTEIQLAVLDMAYTSGINGLNTKFPKFMTALKQSDFTTCALECHRPQVSDQRNLLIMNLFKEAARSWNGHQL